METYIFQDSLIYKNMFFFNVSFLNKSILFFNKKTVYINKTYNDNININNTFIQ